jgi:SAM-dependent methyltransferase
VAGTTLRQRYLRAEEFLVGLIGVALLRLSAADGLTTGDRARLAGPLLQQLQAFLWQLDGLSFSQGWEVLDPRAGYGRYAAHLAGQGRQVVGVDIAAEMLAIAQPRVPTGRIVVGDLCALPLPTASMAGAVSGLALARVGDLAVAMRELARVVRAGGRVVVSVPHPLVVAPAGLQGDPTRSWRPTPRLGPPAPPFGERLPGRVRQRGMGAAPLPRAPRSAQRRRLRCGPASPTSPSSPWWGCLRCWCWTWNAAACRRHDRQGGGRTVSVGVCCGSADPPPVFVDAARHRLVPRAGPER